MKIHDISPPITSSIDVFPGDTAYQREVLMDFDRGDHLVLSRITSTLHLGAHADAPNHYSATGCGIGERDLTRYIGPCQVVDVTHCSGRRVGLRELDPGSVSAPRVLLRTDSFPDPNHWNADFRAVEPDLLQALAQRGVLLIGIDTPSIDPQDDVELPAHQQVARCDMAILEGLVLRNVDAGDYHLVALPLKLMGADASPVRAVLLDDCGFDSRARGGPA